MCGSWWWWWRWLSLLWWVVVVVVAAALAVACRCWCCSCWCCWLVLLVGVAGVGVVDWYCGLVSMGGVAGLCCWLVLLSGVVGRWCWCCWCRGDGDAGAGGCCLTLFCRIECSSEWTAWTRRIYSIITFAVAWVLKVVCWMLAFMFSWRLMFCTVWAA